MAVGDVLELVLTTQNVENRDRYVNVLHWLVNTDAVGAPNEQDLAEKINDAWVANVLVCLNTKANARLCTVQRVFPLPRTAGFQIDNGAGAVGVQAGDALPPACALVVRKRTALAGRKYRGRLFQPMLSEIDQANGVFVGANYTNLSIAWEAILTTLAVGDSGGEYSPILWPKTGAAVADANLITRIAVDPIVRQQRRREVGVGS